MSNDDYEVGYKKPPSHTQFKAGQSGNPKGRPKNTKNFATDLTEELSESIVVTEGGKQRTLSKQRVMIKALMNKALKGDPRSISLIIQHLLSIEEDTSQTSTPDTVSQNDREILDAFRKKLLG